MNRNVFRSFKQFFFIFIMAIVVMTLFCGSVFGEAVKGSSSADDVGMGKAWNSGKIALSVYYQEPKTKKEKKLSSQVLTFTNAGKEITSRNQAISQQTVWNLSLSDPILSSDETTGFQLAESQIRTYKNNASETWDPVGVYWKYLTVHLNLKVPAKLKYCKYGTDQAGFFACNAADNPSPYKVRVTFWANGNTNDGSKALKEIKSKETAYTAKSLPLTINACAAGLRTSYNHKLTGTEVRLYLTKPVEPNQFKIKYNANGGSGKMTPQLVYYGKKTPAKKNQFTFLKTIKNVKTGKNFVSWNTKPNGSGKNIKEGSDVSRLTTQNRKIITLYAQWKTVKPAKIKAPSITFLKNSKKQNVSFNKRVPKINRDLLSGKYRKRKNNNDTIFIQNSSFRIRVKLSKVCGQKVRLFFYDTKGKQSGNAVKPDQKVKSNGKSQILTFTIKKGDRRTVRNTRWKIVSYAKNKKLAQNSLDGSIHIRKIKTVINIGNCKRNGTPVIKRYIIGSKDKKDKSRKIRIKITPVLNQTVSLYKSGKLYSRKHITSKDGAPETGPRTLSFSIARQSKEKKAVTYKIVTKLDNEKAMNASRKLIIKDYYKHNRNIVNAALYLSHKYRKTSRHTNGTKQYQRVKKHVMKDPLNLYRSCDRGAATVIRWSGADVKFPFGGTGNQLHYMKKSSRWKSVSKKALKPGDVLVSYWGGGKYGHIVIWLGDSARRKNKHTDAASASLYRRSLALVKEPRSFHWPHYHAFRLKKPYKQNGKYKNYRPFR